MVLGVCWWVVGGGGCGGLGFQTRSTTTTTKSSVEDTEVGTPPVKILVKNLNIEPQDSGLFTINLKFGLENSPFQFNSAKTTASAASAATTSGKTSPETTSPTGSTATASLEGDMPWDRWVQVQIPARS